MGRVISPVYRVIALLLSYLYAFYPIPYLIAVAEITITTVSRGSENRHHYLYLDGRGSVFSVSLFGSVGVHGSVGMHGSIGVH